MGKLRKREKREKIEIKMRKTEYISMTRGFSNICFIHITIVIL